MANQTTNQKEKDNRQGGGMGNNSRGQSSQGKYGGSQPADKSRKVGKPGEPEFEEDEEMEDTDIQSKSGTSPSKPGGSTGLERSRPERGERPTPGKGIGKTTPGGGQSTYGDE